LLLSLTFLFLVDILGWKFTFYIGAKRKNGSGPVFWDSLFGRKYFNDPQQDVYYTSGSNSANPCIFMQITYYQAFPVLFASKCEKKAGYICERIPGKLKGRMHCFSMQVVMNKCFLLNREKKIGSDPSCPF